MVKSKEKKKEEDLKEEEPQLEDVEEEKESEEIIVKSETPKELSKDKEKKIKELMKENTGEIVRVSTEILVEADVAIARFKPTLALVRELDQVMLLEKLKDDYLADRNSMISYIEGFKAKLKNIKETARILIRQERNR